MGAWSRPESRITRVRSRVLDLPLPAEFRPAWGRNEIQRSFYMTLIEVETAAGITGVTAAEAGPEAALSVERFVSPHLIGQDAAAPERLAGVLRDAEILGPPVYCVEVALWDIAAKIAGLPIYKMWGAVAGRVPAYCATGEVRVNIVHAGVGGITGRSSFASTPMTHAMTSAWSRRYAASWVTAW